jgi:hypothetical protein
MTTAAADPKIEAVALVGMDVEGRMHDAGGSCANRAGGSAAKAVFEYDSARSVNVETAVNVETTCPSSAREWRRSFPIA